MTTAKCSLKNCQFKGYPAEWEHSGKSYCIFHLPLIEKETWDTTKVNFFVQTFHQSLDANTSYDNSHLIGELILDPAVYQKNMSYKKCLFASPCDLVVRGYASFEGSTFKDEVTLRVSSQGWNFSHCTFHKKIKVKKTRGGGISSVQPPPPSLNDVIFSHSIFKSEAIFSDLTLINVIFENCIFEKAPSFERSIINNSVSFLSSSFQSTKGSDEHKYRLLRNAMHQISSRDDEAIFHVCEQRCKRDRKPWSISSLVSYVYDKATEYGSSYEHAIMKLVYFQALFFLYYTIIAFNLNPDKYTKGNFFEILKFTLSQVFKPFETLSFKYKFPDIFAKIDKADELLLYLGTIIHSSLTLIFFALMILALRWRFKRD